MNSTIKYPRLILIAFALATAYNISGQSANKPYPEIGKKCPDFLLTDIRYYTTNQASLADFKGKWLVLDFWNRYCFMCLQSQPHIDSLQKAFKNDVQFMLVGYTGSQYRDRPDKKEIEEIYEKNRKRNNLKLSIAYDSIVFHQFDIRPTPYIVLIDPDGIVRGITYKVTRENLQALINQQKVDLSPAQRHSEFKEAKEAQRNKDFK